MPIGILFWVLMIIWFFLGVWTSRRNGVWDHYAIGGTALEFVLFGLIGWKLFGPVLQ